jgi:hypothetical protein
LSSAFSEDGNPSSSRILSLLHSVIACAGFMIVVNHTHAIPDAATMVGLGGFATVPYIVNSTKSAVQSFSKNPVIPNPNQTADNLNGPPKDSQ